MPVNYTVQAKVVDVRTDQPLPTDRFFIDTNVWLWIAYVKATAQPYQSRFYPTFVSKARRAGARLHWCGLSQPELAHLIERSERDIFEKAHPSLRPATAPRTGWLPTKEFRHNYPAERAKMARELGLAWAQVTSIASPIEVLIDEPLTNAARARFQTQPLDGYDLFMLEATERAGVVQVLTDDGDYCTVPGIQVFTANQNVVALATKQGQLVTR